MLFYRSILVNSDSRIIAFCGEKKRLSLIHRLSEEISRMQKRVIISSPEFRKLSIIGELIIGKDNSLLLSQLRKEFARHPVIHAGKAVQRDSIIGFNFSDVADLKKRLPEHYYLLYDVSNGSNRIFCDKNQITTWIKHAPWHQLVYYFNILHVDQPLEGFTPNVIQAIRKKFPDARTLSQEILVEYFTNTAWGMGRMFRQNWQTVLFIAGVENIRLENRAIQLARALQEQGVFHIVIGNMESLSVRRVTPENRHSDNNLVDTSSDSE